MFERPRKNGVFWLAVAAAGGGISGFLIVVVSLIILLSLLLALFVHIDGKSSASYGNPSLLLVDASHNWTGQSNQAVVNEALHVATALYNGPPEGFDTWYHAEMIPDALAYWASICPGCGNYNIPQILDRQIR